MIDILKCFVYGFAAAGGLLVGFTVGFIITIIARRFTRDRRREPW